MGNKRRVWWIVGAAIVLLTVLAIPWSPSQRDSPQGNSLPEPSAVRKDREFEQVAGIEGERGWSGTIVAEFKTEPMDVNEGEAVMARLAEHFGATNEHRLVVSTQLPPITDTFTFEEGGVKYSVDFYYGRVPESVPLSAGIRWCFIQVTTDLDPYAASEQHAGIVERMKLWLGL